MFLFPCVPCLNTTDCVASGLRIALVHLNHHQCFCTAREKISALSHPTERRKYLQATYAKKGKYPEYISKSKNTTKIPPNQLRNGQRTYIDRSQKRNANAQ